MLKIKHIFILGNHQVLLPSLLKTIVPGKRWFTKRRIFAAAMQIDANFSDRKSIIEKQKLWADR